MKGLLCLRSFLCVEPVVDSLNVTYACNVVDLRRHWLSSRFDLHGIPERSTIYALIFTPR